MNKEFIPYEQALALKELGFNEPCFGYYIETKEWIPASYSFEGTEYPFNSIWPYPTSPTYSQAFRWFREKHNLYPSIISYDTDNHIFTIVGENLYESDDEQDNFDTPEEAELACLKKLIQIVKNK